MDPFSAEGELAPLHSAFHIGQYAHVLSLASSLSSSLSPSNTLPVSILKLRAQIALGDHDAALSSQEVRSSSSADYEAVKVLAQYAKSGGDSKAGDAAMALVGREGDNASVQVCCGTVLAGVGRYQEAVELLGRHQGSLDAVALLIQIHLAQNRLDLAQQEVRKAKSWAQDALLVNIAEAWVGLREGGEKYQSAFYTYEELATAPPADSTATNTRTLLGQSIAELHLGRLPEAEAALQQAMTQTGSVDDQDVIANAIVLNTLLGRSEEVERLKGELGEEHVLKRDLRAKREAFEGAMAKYQPKFEVAA